MFDEDNTTVIKIRRRTRRKLERLALNGETYDEVIERLLDHYGRRPTDLTSTPHSSEGGT